MDNPYLDSDGDIDDTVREDQLRRYLNNPMPSELNRHVQSYIEPHTLNMELRHGDVMNCIHVAFPVIRDYLRDHPEVLCAGADDVVLTTECVPWVYPDAQEAR